MSRLQFAGTTPLVTGAAGGMGTQLARGLVAPGSHLILGLR